MYTLKNVLYTIIFLASLLLIGCSNEEFPDNQTINISEQKQLDIKNFILSQVDEKDLSENFPPDFLENLSHQEVLFYLSLLKDTRIDLGKMTKEEAILSYEWALDFETRSMELYGIPFLQLDLDSQTIPLMQDLNHDRGIEIIQTSTYHRDEGCPEFNYPISSNKGENPRIQAYGVNLTSNPGTTDCDYELAYYVGPMNTTSRLKLYGASFPAKQIINNGGINSRHTGFERRLLVGKGRSDFWYLLYYGASTNVPSRIRSDIYID